MSIVPLNEILCNAKSGGYAVGAFDSWDLESILAIVEAAEEVGSPVVVLTSPEEARHAGMECWFRIAELTAAKASVPVAIMFNETNDFGEVIQAVRCGFGAVMVEQRGMSFAEYESLVKRVVEVCKPVGVAVEAQLGEIPSDREDRDLQGRASAESHRKGLTDPGKAVEFVESTGIDMLAVSVGNIHEMHAGAYELDTELLCKIHGAVGIPIVLHGGTGLSTDATSAAVKAGAYKINVGTVLRRRYNEALSRFHDNGQAGYVEPTLARLRGARDSVKEAVKGMIALYSAG
ncbi:MAG: class II fructose-bisphosphate aldolase [Firmicutes bacterium]|nr:class II fructose-bisphosphate aldolase [Bacillota bacterium]